MRKPLLAAGAILLGLGILIPTPAFAGHLECGDFAFQEDAQAAFDSDPIGLRGLDRDRDGIPCEGNPRRGTTAPTSPTTTAPTTTTSPTTTAPTTTTGSTTTNQIDRVPRGGVDTGDGSMSDNAGLLVVGSLALLAGGALIARRRFVNRQVTIG